MAEALGDVSLIWIAISPSLIQVPQLWHMSKTEPDGQADGKDDLLRRGTLLLNRLPGRRTNAFYIRCFFLQNTDPTHWPHSE